MSSRILTHRAGLDDLDALLANVAAGFASYAEFAQEGWHPPDVHGRREWQGEILADPATWALLALSSTTLQWGTWRSSPGGSEGPGGARRLVGPTDHPRPGPSLAVVRATRLVGPGIAPLLHDESIAEMRAQGYDTARLFTPSQHTRARRFYERRGWSAVAEAWTEDLALPLANIRSPSSRWKPGVPPAEQIDGHCSGKSMARLKD